MAEETKTPPVPELRTPEKPKTAHQKDPATYLEPSTAPSGLVAVGGTPLPISAVARDEKHAKEILKNRKGDLEREQKRSALTTELTEEEINSMSQGDLRAVAATRGYKDIPTAGGAATRAFFLQAQKADKNF
jgi:hypothetical protein